MLCFPSGVGERLRERRPLPRRVDAGHVLLHHFLRASWMNIRQAVRKMPRSSTCPISGIMSGRKSNGLTT
jgi:hypothetical protein